MKYLVMTMILAFFVNLILTKPELSGISKGFVPTRFGKEDLSVVSAMMATSFALAAALYQSYLAQDKGWKKEHLKRSLKDTYIGIILLALISCSLIRMPVS